MTSTTGNELGPYDFLHGLGATALIAAAVAVNLASASPFGPAAFAASLWVVMFSISTSFVGGLVGFLFGVPKLLALREDEPSGNDSKSTAATLRRYVGNTNLESLSDWLTKAIIGAGLVGLQGIPDAIWTASSTIAGSAPGAPAVSVVAAIGVFGFLWGFAYVYLYARTGLLRMMTSAENEAAASARLLESIGEGAPAMLELQNSTETGPPLASENLSTESTNPTVEASAAETEAVADMQTEAEAHAVEIRQDRQFWVHKAMIALPILKSLDAPTPKQLIETAAICRLASLMDDASRIYHQLIKVYSEPGFKTSNEEIAYPYAQLGHIAQQQGQYVVADGFFEQALRHCPDNVHFIYARARNTALAGDDAGATHFLRKAIEMRPAFKGRAKRDQPLIRIVARLDSQPSGQGE